MLYEPRGRLVASTQVFKYQYQYSSSSTSTQYHLCPFPTNKLWSYVCINKMARFVMKEKIAATVISVMNSKAIIFKPILHNS